MHIKLDSESLIEFINREIPLPSNGIEKLNLNFIEMERNAMGAVQDPIDLFLTALDRLFISFPNLSDLILGHVRIDKMIHLERFFSIINRCSTITHFDLSLVGMWGLKLSHLKTLTLPLRYLDISPLRFDAPSVYDLLNNFPNLTFIHLHPHPTLTEEIQAMFWEHKKKHPDFIPLIHRPCEEDSDDSEDD